MKESNNATMTADRISQTVAVRQREESPRRREKVARVKFFRNIDKWIVLVSNCCRVFLSSGSLKSNGVILDELVHELNTSHSLVAWAFSLQNGIAFMATPITRMLLTVLSHRKIAITGGFLFGAGYVYCGLFAVSIEHVFVGYFLSGFGYALTMLPSYLAFEEQFEENFPTATSVVSIFTFFGMSALPPVMKVFKDLYGLHNSLILLGAVLWNEVACGVAIRLPHDKNTPQHTKATLADNENPREDRKNWTTEAQLQNDSKLVKYLSCCSSLIHHRNFALLVIFSVTGTYVTTSWIIFLVSFGTTQGLNAENAVILSTAGGLGGLVGKCLGLSLFYFRKMSPYVCCFPFLITGLTLLISTFTRDFHALLILTCLAGLTQGLTSAALYGYVQITVCKYHFPQAISLLAFIEGIAIQCSGLFSGFLRDMLGSSRYVFGFNAILCFAVSPLMFPWALDDQTVKQCRPVTRPSQKGDTSFCGKQPTHSS